MNLTNLEQSKLLKEWGAFQDTENYWWHNVENGEDFIASEVDHDEWHFGSGPKLCAAYDLESLIEWLNMNIDFSLNAADNMYCVQIAGERGAYPGANALDAVFNLARAIHTNQTDDGKRNT